MKHLMPWLQMYLQPGQIKSQFLQYLATYPDKDPLKAIKQWSRQCKVVPEQEVMALSEWADKPGQGIILYPDLPLTLRMIPDPPVLLFYQGDPGLLKHNMLAVVGSRKPSPAGMENTDYFVSRLYHPGLAIISGLARGIDALAHKTALRAGLPTIAVLGCGLHHFYPKANRFLQAEIRDKGLLLSEFKPDTVARGWHFPRRNRIISGLSEAVLIIEAALGSGSLTTARLAAEQGRQVLAVPGDIHNPMVHGCHALIRDGALMVTSPAEVTEAVAWLEVSDTDVASVAEPLSQKEKQLLKVLDRSPKSVADIIHFSGCELALVLDLLFSLELRGIIVSSVDGYYKPSRGQSDL